jgi:hypothetical protein
MNIPAQKNPAIATIMHSLPDQSWYSQLAKVDFPEF